MQSDGLLLIKNETKQPKLPVGGTLLATRQGGLGRTGQGKAEQGMTQPGLLR